MRPLKVLLIEDSEKDATLVLRELTRGGFAVHHLRVETPTATRQALSESWDLVLADYVVPGFGAVPALKLVRELRLDVPVIVISGTVGEEVAVEVMRAGAHDYVMKDRLTRLVPAVIRELREAQVRRALRRGERWLELQHAIAAVLARSDSWDEVAHEVLSAAGTHLECDFGVLWERDPGAITLRCAQTWGRSGTGALQERCCAARLPAVTWSDGPVAWTRSLSQRPPEPLTDALLEAGLRTTLAFRADAGEGFAVFKLYRETEEPPDEELLRTLATVGGQVGQYLRRSRAVDALRTSEARQRAILESATDAVVTLDAKHAFLAANPAAEKLMGRPRHELLGKRFDELVHFGPSVPLEGSWPPVGRRVDASLRRADGEDVPVEVTLTRTPVLDGGPLTTAFVRDVGAERRTAAARQLLSEATAILARSLEFEETLRSVARLTVPSFADWCVIDLLQDDGRTQTVAIEHVDPTKAELARELRRRYPPAIGSPYGPPFVIRTGQSQPFTEFTEDLLQKIAVDTDHLELLRALDLRSALVAPLIARGRTLGSMSFVTTRSRRRYDEADRMVLEELARRAALAIDNARLFDRAQRLAADLGRQHQWLEAVLDLAPNPLILIEPVTGRITFANKAVQRISGGRFPMASGVHEYDTCYTCTDEEGRRLSADELPGARAARGELVEAFALTWHTSRGPVPLVVSSEVLPAMFGHPAAVLLSLTDVTRLKETARQLREAIQLRDDFLSVAAHELRTPVAIVQLQLQALMAKAEGRPELLLGSPDVARKLQMAERNIAFFQRLVNNLLDVSALREGRLTVEREPVDLLTVVQDVADRCEVKLDAAGCELRIEGTTAPGLWDRFRLEQVLWNLFSNAIKFGAGHPIEVEVRAEVADAIVTVRDHGIGVPVGDRARIFERFERAVSAENYGGLGLGLWISRRIVQAMDGRIDVETPTGPGAQFVVRLPRGARDGIAISPTR